MNILITGAFGFVGTNLSQALKAISPYHLIAVDITDRTDSVYDEYYTWDELEKIDWNNIDVIIHLAGKAHDTSHQCNEKEYFDINVGLTQLISDYYYKSNASKLIFFSSVKAVADSVKGESLIEDVNPEPQTAYGRSKLEAERILLERQKKYSGTNKADGIEKKLYILRPCMIHGPGNKGNLNLLYRLVSKGIPWPLGAFDNQRSYTSIENLQFVISQLIEKGVESGIYNMADDEAISTNELIKIINHSLQKRTHIWRIPKKIIFAFARIGDKLHLPLNSERLKKLTENYIVSNTKIKHAIGINIMPSKVEAGLMKTLSGLK